MKLFNDGQRGCAEFVKREDGAGTVFSLLIFVSLFALGGLAVDVSNVTAARTELQVTADAVAHAALVSRERLEERDAKAVALALAEENMRAAEAGVVIREEEIVFGVWDRGDPDAGIQPFFTPQEGSRSAVQVVARQDTTNANPLATFMLRIVGFDQWDVSVVSVFETYLPGCLREGFVAEKVVDIQSNNIYRNGFCIHSNDVVSMNNNNLFEAGTIVSMPDSTRLDMPPAGEVSNEGLTQALRYGEMQIRLINALSKVPSAPFRAGSEAMWDFIQLAARREDQLDYLTAVPRRVTIVNGQPARAAASSDSVEAGRDLLDKDGILALRQNAVNYVECSAANTQVQIKQALSDVVIITNCQINFGSGGALENGLIATMNTSPSSISGASETRIGRIDNCSEGGGAQLVSLGGMDFASGVSIHGGQLIALREIEFAANGSGLRGTSIISGDTVSGTSNMQMGLCGSGMEDNLALDYFRMVQ